MIGEYEYIPKSKIKLINLTPHDLVVLDDKGKEITIPKSGIVARIEQQQIKQNVICSYDGVFRLVYNKDLESTLPAPEKDTIYIVSLVVLQKNPERKDIIAPDTGKTCIRNEGQIVAVRQFVTNNYKKDICDCCGLWDDIGTFINNKPICCRCEEGLFEE